MSHARLGVYARWYCQSCTVNRYHDAQFPCRECCGYTTQPHKMVSGVLTMKGRPNARCPR